MIKIENLKPGQVVYDCHSHRAGNTTMRTWGVWNVEIREVHDDRVVASWNGNKPQIFWGREFRWLKNKPVLVSELRGMIQRKETAQERKARLAQERSAK